MRASLALDSPATTKMTVNFPGGTSRMAVPSTASAAWRTRACLFACALLLAGCNPRASLAATVAAPEPGFSGPIDGNRAMAFLYGSIDPSLDAAVWAAQGIAKHSPASGVLEDGDKALVSIRLAKAVEQAGIERFYFGIAMVPKREAGQEAFDCESCAPMLGATVFVKRGERWLVEAHNPFMATMGLNGQGGAMELAATGPARHGILVSSRWQNRGNSGTYTELWTVESGKISRRLGVQIAEDNAGNCSEDTKDAGKLERCQEHSLAITFEPGTLPDRYDIHLQPSDPAWPYGEKGGHGEQLLRFDGERYVAVAPSTTVIAPGPASPAVSVPPWTGVVPGNTPGDLLKAFIQADAWGLQTGGHWSLVKQFATWTDGPGWDSSAVIESAEILDRRDLGAATEITVRMSKLGDLGTDDSGMPRLDASTAGVVTRRFVLAAVREIGAKDARWKIVEPQDGPHLSVGYALNVLLPRWCDKRDCTNNDAFRALSVRQATCAPSAIAINRNCVTSTK